MNGYLDPAHITEFPSAGYKRCNRPPELVCVVCLILFFCFVGNNVDGIGWGWSLWQQEIPLPRVFVLSADFESMI